MSERGQSAYTGNSAYNGANGNSGSLYSLIRNFQGAGFQARSTSHWDLTTEPKNEVLT